MVVFCRVSSMFIHNYNYEWTYSWFQVWQKGQLQLQRQAKLHAAVINLILYLLIWIARRARLKQNSDNFYFPFSKTRFSADTIVVSNIVRALTHTGAAQFTIGHENVF